jgi:hypothetical protein
VDLNINESNIKIGKNRIRGVKGEKGLKEEEWNVRSNWRKNII